MKGINTYMEALSAAALICAAVMCFAGSKGSFQALLKLLAGVFLVTVMIQPVLELKLDPISGFAGLLEADYEEAVRAGEEIASIELERGIAERTAAYILEEADRFDCELTVEITLSDHVPSSVTLEGAVSPYAKTYLSRWITENLNVPAEAQRWIG